MHHLLDLNDFASLDFWARYWDYYRFTLFAGALLTVGLGYLGSHVVKRQIIFVDLAQAQIASLGPIIAALYGAHLGRSGEEGPNTAIYLLTLVCVLLGSIMFTIVKPKKVDIPHEALIGSVYIAASALGILLISGTTGGAEHFVELRKGQIDFLSLNEGEIIPSGLVPILIVFLVLGVVHVVFYKKFQALAAEKAGINETSMGTVEVAFWDFLFYLSIGVVVSVSVQLVGVELIFAYLIIPVIAGALASKTMWKRALVGIVVGNLATFLGLAISLRYDTPGGPAIVNSFLAILAVIAIVRYVFVSNNRVMATIRLAAGLSMACAILYFGNRVLENAFAKHDDHEEHEREHEEHSFAAEHHYHTVTWWKDSAEAREYLSHATMEDVRSSVRSAIESGDTDAFELIEDAFPKLLETRDPKCLWLLYAAAAEGEGELAKEDAIRLLQNYTGRIFDDLDGWSEFLQTAALLRWNEEKRQFLP
ncbi:MAG: metal ABC transporter permease [Planctomycetes bacterium]|nr:metal ABC transporter permease [Planctomycetota bacterium]